jgi:beta-hydroxylase
MECILYAPSNILYSAISKIPCEPVYHPTYIFHFLPELQIIQNNWKIIRKEYQQIKNKLKPIKGEKFFEDDIIKTEKWERYYIKWYSDISSKTSDELPKTTQLLNKCPNIQLAMFSVMKPGTIVYPHRGPNRGSLRVHLALEAPSIENGCYIIIDNIKYGWNEGEMLIFDDTYTHEVQNNSNKERVVLFMDINRPVYVKFIQNAINKYVSRDTLSI